jgi:hypothetical protein
MPRSIDLTGLQFGHLTVIRIAEGLRIRKGLAWVCLCDPDLGGCGTEKIIASNALRMGHAQSCGCRMHDRKHGQSSAGNPQAHPDRTRKRPTPEYMAWGAMKQRCLNPRHESFARYGGRGVSVCPEWIESFEAFYAYIGPRPGRGYSLDRYPDNCGNYEPGNVRWATWEEQNRNLRPRTPGLKRNRAKPPPRYADCHPDRLHMAHGLCEPCYKAAWHKEHYSAGQGYL